MRKLTVAVLALVMGLCTAVASAVEQIPVDNFFRDSSFDNVKISPDGRYLAATVPLEKLTALVVMDLESKKITGSFRPQEKAHIGQFYWVNNERLIFTSGVREGKFARPSGTGVYYAMNADGSKIGTAYGRGYYPQLLDSMKDDDKYVLVQYASDGGSSTYGKLNVENGDIQATRRRPPVEGYGQFITDNASEVRLYVMGKNFKDYKVYIRKGDSWSWDILHETKSTEQDFEYKAFSADNTLVYFTLSEKSGPDGLYSYNIKTGERKLVSRDDNVNPGVVMTSPVDGTPYAVRYEDGFPRYDWLDKNNPYARALLTMQASFKDADVYPVSSTRSGDKVVYAVFSDTLAGDYYLFDIKAQQARHLVSRMSWLDPAKMALMEPMKFKARDGLELEVFVTLPKDSKGKNLPLIVNPHGGPFGPYDTWGFNPETQMLANRGYAVMQVNFRGSGNYGKEFQEKGYRQWGKQMQDDVTDATRWAISQGFADPNRICIYGASYGAYTALMGAAKEPSLYRCAVGNVGVYDLPDIVSYDSGQGGGMNPLKVFFRETTNSSDMESSPTRVANRIKVPVYLMAGEKDTTAPQEQTKKMYKALTDAGVPVQMKIYEGEEHGNVLVENQRDFANRLLAFLEANLKPGNIQSSDLKPVQ